jgi:hypothetical protein
MGRVVHSNFILIRGIPRFKFEGRQVVCMYFKLQCFKKIFFRVFTFTFRFRVYFGYRDFYCVLHSTAEVVRCVQVIKEIINSSKVVLLS